MRLGNCRVRWLKILKRMKVNQKRLDECKPDKMRLEKLQ